GLKRNDRSSKPTPGCNDGSYSLASTVEQGQGQGSFQPAVQTDTPAARTSISRVLILAHELQQLIMPCSLSAFEWKICQFHMTDNNVFVFGGLDAGGATGCQFNSSSGMGSLQRMIGALQGKWHADISDAWFYWTFGILMMKLPPAKEEWIDKEALLSLINLVHPQNRAFLVNYPTEVGNSRIAALSVTPPLHFMNQGAPIPHKLHQKNFAQHGRTILGSPYARSNRLGREIIWAALNAMEISGLKLSIPSSELFKLITYDNDGESRALEPPPFSVDGDRDYIIKMRGYFAWY
ncbi:hypothetical protein DFH09DRAFT_838194, partial [Mycena vulgaris]